MKKQSDHALATHTHKAASFKAKAAKVAVRGATQPRMPTSLQKITLTVLPLVGLLWTAPLAFVHDNGGKHGRVHNEFNE